ncbi:uncharacterized protein EI90DRAFT_3059158 [Cantharellus anzutake]|uniref:uncharacterized protein n=1 Tax=Cantharellus anzutake TaxID=1750568 RepID=UPI0019034F16|nr:uncharacterized protein EI90DRAFT_3059158 [Cantharellus anzutake]KAF8330746.1 hypothetical protein EI90DRAFT_3059158 [Cantharellus anzutake]
MSPLSSHTPHATRLSTTHKWHIMLFNVCDGCGKDFPLKEPNRDCKICIALDALPKEDAENIKEVEARRNSQCRVCGIYFRREIIVCSPCIDHLSKHGTPERVFRDPVIAETLAHFNIRPSGSILPAPSHPPPLPTTTQAPVDSVPTLRPDDIVTRLDMRVQHHHQSVLNQRLAKAYQQRIATVKRQTIRVYVLGFRSTEKNKLVQLNPLRLCETYENKTLVPAVEAALLSEFCRSHGKLYPSLPEIENDILTFYWHVNDKRYAILSMSEWSGNTIAELFNHLALRACISPDGVKERRITLRICYDLSRLVPASPKKGRKRKGFIPEDSEESDLRSKRLRSRTSEPLYKRMPWVDPLADVISRPSEVKSCLQVEP